MVALGEGEEATVFAVQSLLVGDLPCAEEDASDYDEDVIFSAGIRQWVKKENINCIP